MLILSKEKAVERMLALTAAVASAGDVPAPAAGRGRAARRVAVYQRRLNAERASLRQAELAHLLRPVEGSPSA